MRAVLPTMIEQRYGKIVNVGGTFGLRGRALRMAYSASKWGLRGITKSTALEVGPHNINVNCVCPGMVDGPRFQKVCAERADKLGITIEEARAQHEAEYALRRISTDQDVANAILFFASDASQEENTCARFASATSSTCFSAWARVMSLGSSISSPMILAS